MKDEAQKSGLGTGFDIPDPQEIPSLKGSV